MSRAQNADGVEDFSMKTTTTKMPDGSEKMMLGGIILKEKPRRKRARNSAWKFSPEMLRMREIEKVIRHRHGTFIPDPSGTDDIDLCLCYLRAVAMTPGNQDLESWCARWAPWANPQTIEEIEKLRIDRKRMLKADDVARLLMVSFAERTKLKLRTIGAYDVTKIERTELAKEKKRATDKNRQKQKRIMEGRQDRASYEAASISKAKPWEILGISRAGWYRKQRETGLSRIVLISKSDTLVSSNKKGSWAKAIETGQNRCAVLTAGLGDDPPAEFQEAGPLGNVDTAIERAA